MSEHVNSRCELSVIVPVFNQWHLVAQLLENLHTQSLDQQLFEVLLVDNGSETLPNVSDLPHFVRFMECRQPGSYAARNAGAAAAGGSVFAFTDADCLPDRTWLAELASIFREPGATQKLVAGHIEVFTWQPITAAARYDMALGFPQARYVSRGYGVTANLAMTRTLFEKVKGFDPQRLSGGDAEFCRRAVKQGADLVYCSTAVVSHPARRSMNELIRKARRIKGGQLRNGPWRRRVAFAVRAFAPPVRAWWRIWRTPDLGVRGRLVVSAVQARLWIAEVAETIRLSVGARAERR